MTSRRNPLDSLDFMPLRYQEPGDTKRDRSWEHAQRSNPATMQVTYRGVPRALNSHMREMAQEHGKTVSQIAVAYLEFATDFCSLRDWFGEPEDPEETLDAASGGHITLGVV